jgi:hypothetical protein
MTKHLATFAELQEVYGVEDMYNLLEVAMVNAHNTNVVNQPD